MPPASRHRRIINCLFRFKYANHSLSRARGLLAVPSNADATQYARSGYISGLERAKKIYAR